MPLERVHLIRHAQTAWNAEGRWQGFELVPLDETGVAQARALAAAWSRPLSAILCSDLPRAWQTAAILGEATGITPRPEHRLREFNLGIFQGLTPDEMLARFPAEVAAFKADYMGYLIPKGESRTMLQARVFELWQEIVAQEPGPEIALVSHGGTLRMLLVRLLGDGEPLKSTRLVNTSVTTLARDGGGWHLERLAETSHLAGISFLP